MYTATKLMDFNAERRRAQRTHDSNYKWQHKKRTFDAQPPSPLNHWSCCTRVATSASPSPKHRSHIEMAFGRSSGQCCSEIAFLATFECSVYAAACSKKETNYRILSAFPLLSVLVGYGFLFFYKSVTGAFELKPSNYGHFTY